MLFEVLGVQSKTCSQGAIIPVGEKDKNKQTKS
jgi:hypothetical protein